MPGNTNNKAEKQVNYRVTLSYDGTNYSGFQIQENALAIQEVLESCLQKLFGHPLRITAAGRTDAGTHAKEQVINFFAAPLIPPARLPLAMNGILPWDIVVTGAGMDKESFDARRDASGKFYSYTIDNGKYPDVFWRRFAWHVYDSLEIQPMREAAAFLVGEHDFQAFQAAGSAMENTVRRIDRLTMEREGRFIRFEVEGNGFLYKMIRNIVGTLVEVGCSRKRPGEMKDILKSRDRRAAGITAPARGLCLEEVFY